MSYHPSPREQHLSHVDNRNEAAQRLRDAVRSDERSRLVDERWRRNVQVLLSNPDAVEDDDFPGCRW